MRMAFLGGHGHHYLRAALGDPAVEVETPVAVAPCGCDGDSIAALAQQLASAGWGAASGAASAGSGAVSAAGSGGRSGGSGGSAGGGAGGGARVRVFDSAEQLLREFRPDLVSVGGVYASNGDLAAAALERDIPVVSDKPVAVNWQQLERLRALTAGTGRVLLTEFDFRSRAAFRAARDAVRAGKVGEPVLVTAQKSYRFGTSRPAWYAERARYGGTMLWVASHAIDAIRFVSGRAVVAVTGRQANVTRPEYGTMEDHCTALFELAGGGTAIAHADYLRPAAAPTHGDDRLRVAGSAGVLEVRGDRCVLLNANGEQDITALAAPRPMHVELMAALAGTETELYSTAESLEMAAVLLKSREAADRQEWVRVER